MTQGTIQTLHAERGFGFIALEERSQDIYFHGDHLDDALFATLREGQRVQFILGSDPNNPYRLHAERVQLLDAE